MDEHLLFLFSFLDEVEKEIADDAEKQVWIEKCINIKTLSDFTVSCSYGDMVLIICVLKDYLKLIANKEGPTWDYYRDKFSKMAYRLSGQIGYNYEKAYERCQKKMNGKNSNDDIGEDAMALAVKYGGNGKKKSEKSDSSDPESMARGYGPECWSQITGEPPDSNAKVGDEDEISGQMNIFDFPEYLPDTGEVNSNG